MQEKHIGTVVQVIGPVLDIRFEDGQLPALLNAIEIELGENKLIVEVAQHIGDNLARCIAMSSTDGLVRGMQAVDTGRSITVPVGEQTLGRILRTIEKKYYDSEPLNKAYLYTDRLGLEYTFAEHEKNLLIEEDGVVKDSKTPIKPHYKLSKTYLYRDKYIYFLQ